MKDFSNLTDDELMQCIKFNDHPEKKSTCVKKLSKKSDQKLFEKLLFNSDRMERVELCELIRDLKNKDVVL